MHMVIAAVLTAYPSPTDAAAQSAVLTLTIAPLPMYFMYRQARSYSLRMDERRTAKVRVVRVRDETFNASLLESSEMEL